MPYPKLQDDDETELELLREIRDAVRGVGDTQVSGATSVRVHEVSGNFAPPQETINIANQQWVSHKLSPMNYDDLAPGDKQTIVSMESDQTDLYVAVKAVSTSQHAHDLKGDGELESAVEYRHEYKTHDGGEWVQFPGLGGTLPLGTLGDPVEIITGSYIGPMAGYRIRYENRSAGMSNEVTIPAEKLGAQIAGIAITGDSE